METLTDEEAGEIVRLVMDRLQAIGALAVIQGIEESRRLGVEEWLDDHRSEDRGGVSKEVKQLGTIRRRPPTEREMLCLVLERLRQRLVILPAIGRALQKALNSSDVSWRVDKEFVPSDQSGALEGRIGDLLPDGINEVDAAYRRIAEMIPASRED